MPLYNVTTRSQTWRTYQVRADNEKDAIAKSCEAQPITEEDENTETMTVELVQPAMTG